MAMSIAAILGLLFMLFILAMFVGGIVLIVKSRRRGSEFPTCGGCGYDLTGSTAATDLCPECGGQFTVVGIITPKSERKTGLLVIGIILLILPLTCGGLLTFALAAPLAARGRAAPQAIIAQQQFMIQSLTADQKQIKEELASLNTQLAETTDEIDRRELEAAILKLEQDLESLDAELEEQIAEQDDAGDLPE